MYFLYLTREAWREVKSSGSWVKQRFKYQIS